MILESLDNQLAEVIESARIHVSRSKPSEWYEKNMVMPRGSAFPGPFRFHLTPYWREPLDCAAKDHPAKEITIMKGAQLGGSAAVLHPIVGYTIAQNPGHIMFLTGHSDLSEDAVVKIDGMIDNCGLRPLIRPNILRAKNSRTGDTNRSKEFPGGDFHSGSVTNHNLLRQYDVQIMIVDDFDAAPRSSKSAGSTRELVQKRCSAFAHKKKIYYISSPQLKGQSNIEEVFLLGDQRYYHVPCPRCHERIILKWSVPIDDKNTAGIVWKLDNHGRVDRNSVGYVCQKCAGFFTDSHKYEMNINGLWVPTAIPMEEDHWSYHLSGIYAPPGMDSWAHYAMQYEAANPPGRPRDEKKYQTFVNVGLGETYEAPAESPKANELQQNIRNYEIGAIPEKLSIEDGNGKIVLLTLACDLNGKLEDARLDYEIVAWSVSGSSYSITHGSIGTFIPNESAKKNKVVRESWTYIHHRPNSVWPELDKIINTVYETGTGRKMRIGAIGIDTGHCENEAFLYIDSKHNLPVVGLKGDKEDKYIPFGVDMPAFKVGRSRPNLYLLRGGQIKDELATLIKLKWDEINDDIQPGGFMNFPTPSGGKYTYKSFFSHYESEERVIEKNKTGEGISALWRKKNGVVQNHLWDCRYYNMGLRQIFLHNFFKAVDFKNGTWADYCAMIGASSN